MLNNFLIFTLTAISFSAISYIIYIKIIAPLTSITDYIQEAKFEHNIINKLEHATDTHGLSDRYNLMLDNNISESSYFEKLEQSLKQRTATPTNSAAIKPSSSLLNQTQLLQQKKKQINYH
ncbi:MAG: type III secretory pathway component EscR [Moritella dasanensis]|jgi:type III secretory pathway component EscR